MEIVDFPIKHGDFPIENSDFPIKNGDFPWQNVCSPEGKLIRFGIDPPGTSPTSGWPRWPCGNASRGAWIGRRRRGNKRRKVVGRGRYVDFSTRKKNPKGCEIVV